MTTQDHLNNVKLLVQEAIRIDAPYYSLLKHQREIQKKVNQENCEHKPLQHTTVKSSTGTVSIWTCEDCDKEIDTETNSSKTDLNSIEK